MRERTPPIEVYFPFAHAVFFKKFFSFCSAKNSWLSHFNNRKMLALWIIYCAREKPAKLHNSFVVRQLLSFTISLNDTDRVRLCAVINYPNQIQKLFTNSFSWNSLHNYRLVWWACETNGDERICRLWSRPQGTRSEWGQASLHRKVSPTKSFTYIP